MNTVTTNVPDPLAKYSLTGRSSELASQLVDQKFVLEPIALTGQATVIYAPPNTGKTLITLKLLGDSICKGDIDPLKVYYFNMDDHAAGLVEKLEIAEEFGFNMIVDGYLGFAAKNFVAMLHDLVKTAHPKGMVILVDTIKKVADLMSKRETSDFAKAARQFVLKGGTLVGLAHTNKSRSLNGKLIHAGTSDLMDDLDCAYIVDTLATGDDGGLKTIEMANKKRRGNVAETVAFSYSDAPGASYKQMFKSVQQLASEDVMVVKKAAVALSDSVVIEAIKSCIKDGIVQKMMLAEKAAALAGIGRNAVIEIIDRYSGSDEEGHHWNFKRGARGAKSYSMNGSQPASPPGCQHSSLPVSPASAPDPMAAAEAEADRTASDIRREKLWADLVALQNGNQASPKAPSTSKYDEVF